ncbi:hydrogenase maturation nickel metallochaperone HypA [Gallaecimonas kandeliae]|uniref:hydrogenase maturation nickel metallochaperone HypA/HybF n=1 Tax=Gallaecimonas kandeliae TaxID=3029055 RepID=UPI002647D2B6|nr:hydrogenase maturation nickel metallochaperone HypA [Gallaecimonas kandeliae]WKE64211.1 hydrogenase maturation nickel metallochaperone HypA [Gallaecimonas kandeliae]
MHELSVVRALLDQLTPYRDRAIASIRIEMGALSCVDAERLGFCFEMVKDEAGLADAELHIDRAQAEARCQCCGQVFEVVALGSPCPCGSHDYTLLTGRQLLLTEIGFS